MFTTCKFQQSNIQIIIKIQQHTVSYIFTYFYGYTVYICSVIQCRNQSYEIISLLYWIFRFTVFKILQNDSLIPSRLPYTVHKMQKHTNFKNNYISYVLNVLILIKTLFSYQKSAFYLQHIYNSSPTIFY